MLRLFGLKPGAGEESLHSPEELKLLVAASQEAGLLQHAQQEVVERVLTIGERPIADIMTPRRDVEWIDADDPPRRDAARSSASAGTSSFWSGAAASTSRSA